MLYLENAFSPCLLISFLLSLLLFRLVSSDVVAGFINDGICEGATYSGRI